MPEILPENSTTIDKPWGHATPLYCDRNIELLRVNIHQGGRSSRHFHRDKCNTFIVQSGHLTVRKFHSADSDRPYYETLLNENSLPFRVTPRVWHEFEAMTPVQAHEIYHSVGGVPIDPQDIVRASE